MRTLLISLGGERYPSAPSLAHHAFGPSSRSIAQLLAGPGGIVSGQDHLNLFDDDRSWPDQLLVTRDWIRERRSHDVPAPENVVVHYVGHGWFKPNSQDHLLTINHTDKDEKVVTSIALGTLNDMLLREAGRLRRYYLIDACFAAASVRDLMADFSEAVERQVGAIIRAWPDTDDGTRGVAALCSADKSTTATAKGNDSLTQFTDGLITVLKTGDPTRKTPLSLRNIYALLVGVLRSRYNDAMVHPVLVAPNDADGGIAEAAVFGNAALRDVIQDTASAVVDVSVAVFEPGAAEDDILAGERAAEKTQTAGTTEPGHDTSSASVATIEIAGRPDNERKHELELALNEDPNFRTTMYRFFRLNQSDKDDIVETLHLGRVGDNALTDLDRFKSALKRARNDGMIGRLEKLIDKAETAN